MQQGYIPRKIAKVMDEELAPPSERAEDQEKPEEKGAEESSE